MAMLNNQRVCGIGKLNDQPLTLEGLGQPFLVKLGARIIFGCAIFYSKLYYPLVF